jgi:tetratricopeptide (TPR) repeat protein
MSFKETGAVVVLIAPASLLLLGGRRDWRKAAVAGGSALAAAAAFYLVWRHFKSPNFCPELFCATFPMAPTLNFLTSVSEVYLRLLVIPWPLRAWYPFDCLSGPGDPRLWLALARMGVVLCAAGALAARSRLAALATVWACVAFVPVSQIIAIPDRVAERFCYQPMFCAGLAAAAGYALLTGRFPGARRVLIVCYAMLVAAWAILTHVRAYDWQDNPTLLLANWEETGDPRPEGLSIAASIYLNRAGERAARGDAGGRDDDLARARIKIRRLLEKEPENPDGHRLAAVLQLHLGNREAAARHATEALRLAPDDSEARDTARRSGIAVDTGTTTATD